MQRILLSSFVSSQFCKCPFKQVDMHECTFIISSLFDLSSMAKCKTPCCCIHLLLVVVSLSWFFSLGVAETEYISAIGDPGMRRDGLRLAIESWNQCNEVGEENPYMGSPRAADCFDIYKASPQPKGELLFSNYVLPVFSLSYVYIHRVCSFFPSFQTDDGMMVFSYGRK